MKPIIGTKYDTSKWFFWLLWIFIIIYTVLMMIWITVYVQNITITHTWFKTPGLPGNELTSYRNSFTAILIRMTIWVHLFVPFVIMAMIAYRRVALLSYILYGILIVFFFICFFCMSGLADQYSRCNGQDQFGNICNDPKWCCVTEIWNHPANMCPNTLDCTPPLTIDDVHPRSDFLGLFWIHFVLMICLLGFLILITYFWRTTEDSPEEEIEEEEILEEEQEVEKEAPAIEYTNSLVTGLEPVMRRRRVTHSLKK